MSEEELALPEVPTHAIGQDAKDAPTAKTEVVYHFRDINEKMVAAFHEFMDEFDHIEVSHGDIFREAPQADAIVSPANSFGFMDGGIDMAYTRHFGWQLSERLRHIIREEYDGELLVGQALVLPTYEKGECPADGSWSQFNGGEPIKYLISAPTMRIPMIVADTPNAYLAFRAVLLAVQKHNAARPDAVIRRVLCPGLATAVGAMPKRRCALQMRKAYEAFELGKLTEWLHPVRLDQPYMAHESMTLIQDKPIAPPPTDDDLVEGRMNGGV